MPSITIELSIKDLSNLSGHIEHLYTDSCQTALKFYPEEKYKKLIQESVLYGQAQVHISNLLAIKTVEIGLTILDNKIRYLEQRADHLTNFYVKSTSMDSEILKNRIADINKEILDQKRSREILLDKKFSVDIPEELQQLLKKLLP